MKAFHLTSVMSALCKATGKYGMFASFHVPPEKENELFLAAPWLREIDARDDEVCINDPNNGWKHVENALQMVGDGVAFLLFDTQEEMERYFDMTVGDDGPTPLNDYNGEVRVYALTFDKDGTTRNENT